VRQVAKYSTPSSEAVHPSKGELAQSSSGTYGTTCSEGGQGGRLQNTPPRPAKLSTPQEGN